MTLEEVERDHLSRVLAFTGGAIAEAAEILGIHRNTLARKLDRYRLRPLDDRE
jgi:DNA-binding protein Fis